MLTAVHEDKDGVHWNKDPRDYRPVEVRFTQTGLSKRMVKNIEVELAEKALGTHYAFGSQYQFNDKRQIKHIDGPQGTASELLPKLVVNANPEYGTWVDEAERAIRSGGLTPMKCDEKTAVDYVGKSVFPKLPAAKAREIARSFMDFHPTRLSRVSLGLKDGTQINGLLAINEKTGVVRVLADSER
jgi:hypothetical protein